MAVDPFRRSPMVDFAHPAGRSLFWRISDAMERLTEQLENYSPADLFFQKIDRDIAIAEAAINARTDVREEEEEMSQSDNPGHAFLAELEHDAHRYAEEAWVDQEFFPPGHAPSPPPGPHVAGQAFLDNLEADARRSGVQARTDVSPEQVRERAAAAQRAELEREADAEDELSDLAASEGRSADADVHTDAAREWRARAASGAESPDASDGRFDPPPAAEPYVPPRATTDHGVHTRCRVDRVRWLGPGRPDTPTEQRPPRAVTTTASSGGAMATIEEARAGVMAGKDVGEQVLAGLTQQHTSLEEVQNGLRHATTGSNQGEAESANTQLAEAMTKIEEAKQLIASALQEFEGVAQRL